MTQPKTTAKKTTKTTKRSKKATEAKMAELAKQGEAMLAADAKKAKRKTATRKKAAAKKKTAATAKATPKPKAAEKPTTTTAKPTADDQTPKRGRRAIPGKDPRIPAVGTKIVRSYKGQDYEVTVLADGFRWNEGVYTSLSKLASAITGAKSINGLLWFRLTEPKQD